MKDNNMQHYTEILGEYKRPDFYAIASGLYQRVLFVLGNCKNLGVVSTMKDDGTEYEYQSVDEYLAQGIELWPGAKVNRTQVELKNMTKAQRKKAKR